MQLFNQQILKKVSSIVLVPMFFLCISISAANALQSDFKEMITIDSDKQFADMENDHVVFTSNVEIHQGTIYLKANKVEVFRENPNKKNQHTKLIAYGSGKDLAIYEQTMDDGTRIHAEGKVLSYDVSVKQIVVEGNAYVKKQDNVIQSDKVVYDMNKAQMIATVKSGQVRTVLIPDQLSDKKADSNEKNESKAKK